MSNLEVVFGELLAQNALAARQSEIENFIQSLHDFFSRLRLTPPPLAFVTKRKIFAMTMSGSIMEILNSEEISLD